MAFQIGNITISARPTERDFKSRDGDTVFCSSCGKECHEVASDNSFTDGFGEVTNWSVGSNCCDAEVFTGTIFLNKVTTRTARKDYLNNQGKVYIKKGQKYKASIKKGYYVDNKGKHHGIFEYNKYTFGV